MSERKVVPREPTQAMLAAGSEAGQIWWGLGDIWPAMYDAAPIVGTDDTKEWGIRFAAEWLDQQEYFGIASEMRRALLPPTPTDKPAPEPINRGLWTERIACDKDGKPITFRGDPDGERMSPPDASASVGTDDTRDREWICAMAASLGMDSGYNVPIVPTKAAFDELFAAVRSRVRGIGDTKAEHLIDRCPHGFSWRGDCYLCQGNAPTDKPAPAGQITVHYCNVCGATFAQQSGHTCRVVPAPDASASVTAERLPDKGCAAANGAATARSRSDNPTPSPDASASVLTERLRTYPEDSSRYAETLWLRCQEAADEIDRLSRELAGARASVETQTRAKTAAMELWNQCGKDLQAAEAELAQARELIRKYIRDWDWYPDLRAFLAKGGKS